MASFRPSAEHFAGNFVNAVGYLAQPEGLCGPAPLVKECPEGAAVKDVLSQFGKALLGSTTYFTKTKAKMTDDASENH